MMNNSELSGSKRGNCSRRDLLKSSSAAAAYLVMNSTAVRGTEANSRVRMGLIGLGGRGMMLARMIKAMQGYEIAALADYFPEVVQAAGTELAVAPAHCFSGLLGYQRLIASKVDAVVLETPPYCFPLHAAAAVEAGRHVYMAKPVAVDVPGTISIQDSAQKAKVKKQLFFVDFQMRTDPMNIETVRRCHEGQIGKVSLLTSHYSDEGFPDLPLTQTIESRLQRLVWCNDIALGAGYFGNAGIHAVDACLWLAREVPGRASGASSTGRTEPHGDSPDLVSLTYYFPSGLILNHVGEHIRNTHEFQCFCNAYGSDGYLEISYTGKAFLRGNKGGFKGGQVENLYPTGAQRNLDLFLKLVTAGDYRNDTVEPAINANLTVILGREAGARKTMLTMADLLKENKPYPASLRGLKE